ncbi:MAG: S8 family serine peptidase, partial [Chloroflexota bacterium]
ADRKQLLGIALVLDVAWVDAFQIIEKHNEYGGGQLMGSNIANANGYDGSTQIVAVADTGLGGGTAATAHVDIPASRIVSINNWPGVSDTCWTITNDGAVDVDSGHGTHTALSVVGDGGVSGEGKSPAPAASLVFQAVENYADMIGICGILYPDGYYLPGLNNLNGLYQEAYNAGARIHSNSWGSDSNGQYTANSVTSDTFIWNNQDMLITFSAGNSGKDANNDGVVDNDSIGAPATAKNVLTVGASEGDRQGNYQCDAGLTYTSHDAYQSGQTCTSMGGNQTNFLGTAGSRWGFSTEPLKSDVTAGNAQQMAPFSSRGPVDDGRIKPDVVAPGTWVLSGYSSQYQEGYGDPTNPRNGTYQSDGWGMPRNQDYKYFGGTSMANPLAAGGAAVVRDFYQKAHGINASAALVKATLINSAADLLDENNDGLNDNDFPIPNNHEGWGFINLVNATDNTAQFVDATTGLATGGNVSFNYNVNAGTPLKVTLVWSDYPSATSATVNLVNDLDLTVTAPGGTVYRGNVFSGGWSATGGTADRRNNVENVYLQAP